MWAGVRPETLYSVCVIEAIKWKFNQGVKVMAGTKGRSGGNRAAGGGDPIPRDSGPVADESLSDDERLVFAELVERLPCGLLRAIDGYQLAGLSRLIVRERVVAEGLRCDPLNLQLGRLQVAIVNQIARLSAQFGLSPADRARLSIEPEPQESQFTILLDRMMKRA